MSFFFEDINKLFNKSNSFIVKKKYSPSSPTNPIVFPSFSNSLKNFIVSSFVLFNFSAIASIDTNLFFCIYSQNLSNNLSKVNFHFLLSSLSSIFSSFSISSSSTSSFFFFFIFLFLFLFFIFLFFFFIIFFFFFFLFFFLFLFFFI